MTLIHILDNEETFSLLYFLVEFYAKKFIKEQIQKQQFWLTQRRLERGISLEEIKRIVVEGEIIAYNEKAKPYPTAIVLGYKKHGAPIHVVVFQGDVEPKLRIVTVYEPEARLWDIQYKKRKL